VVKYLNKLYKERRGIDKFIPEEIEHQMMVGSKLEFDESDKEYKDQVIRDFEKAVEHGKFVIMYNLEIIYEFLYDFFGQRYSVLPQSSVFCKVVFDDNVTETKIHRDFRCLIIKSGKTLEIKKDLERHLPSSLRVRFEKHIFTLDDPIRQFVKNIKLGEIQKYMADIFLQNPVLEDTELYNESWQKLGNRFIFCFQNGEILKILALHWEMDYPEIIKEKLKPDEFSMLLKYEFFFSDLIRYYSIRMFLIHYQFIQKEIGDKEKKTKILNKLIELYKKSHKDESLETFLSDDEIHDRPDNWVIFTRSRNTEYKVDDKTVVLYSKELENIGDREICNHIKYLTDNDEKTKIIFSLENKKQFKHLKYFLWHIEEWLIRRKKITEKRKRKMIKYMREKIITKKEEDEDFFQRYNLLKKEMGVIMHFVDEEDDSHEQEENHWYYCGANFDGHQRIQKGRFFVIEDLNLSFAM
jgi:hypothetical protein